MRVGIPERNCGLHRVNESLPNPALQPRSRQNAEIRLIRRERNNTFTGRSDCLGASRAKCTDAESHNVVGWVAKDLSSIVRLRADSCFETPAGHALRDATYFVGPTQGWGAGGMVPPFE